MTKFKTINLEIRASENFTHINLFNQNLKYKHVIIIAFANTQQVCHLNLARHINILNNLTNMINLCCVGHTQYNQRLLALRCSGTRPTLTTTSLL